MSTRQPSPAFTTLTHGQCRKGHRSPAYISWISMKSRCTNPNWPGYERYHGRGIRVCERWMNSFVDFLADMGPRPPGTTLDRIDNDKGYEPGNCRWATSRQQAVNKSQTRILVHEGRSMSMVEWAEEIGINYSALQERIRKWPLARALTEPSHARRSRQ